MEWTVDASFGVPVPLVDSLAVIDGAEELLTPGQIAERTVTSSATMTATLDALERLCWAGRLPNPVDRRSALIVITERGRIAGRSLPAGVRVLEQAVLGALSEAERRTLMGLLASSSPALPPTRADSKR